MVVRRFLVALALLAACGDNIVFEDLECPPTPLQVAAPSDDIVARLRALPGVDAHERTESRYPGYRSFDLTLNQAVDHDSPCRQRFTQHLTLLYRSDDAPTVLASTGYDNYYGDHAFEVTELLQANQLILEHRYFPPSRPSPARWQYLDIRQAAADHHRVVELFRPLLTGPWLTTGGSKGGMTSLFHARFHPGDVDGVVPYVAPLSLGAPDTRYDAFFHQLGTAECRQAVRDLQVEMLTNRRDALETRARWQADEKKLVYRRVSLGAAVESSISSAEWAFWQYRGDRVCAQVPAVDASDDAIWAWLDETSPPSGDTDDRVARFEAYLYQVYAQLGYPSVSDEHLDPRLFRYDGNDYDTFPHGTPFPDYDPAAMQDVAEWVRTDGDRILLIYGELDPWTAGAVDLGAATDSLRVTAPGGNHNVGVDDLAPGDRAAVLARLEAWTGVVPDPDRVTATARARRADTRIPPSVVRAWMRRAGR